MLLLSSLFVSNTVLGDVPLRGFPLDGGQWFIVVGADGPLHWLALLVGNATHLLHELLMLFGRGQRITGHTSAVVVVRIVIARRDARELVLNLSNEIALKLRPGRRPLFGGRAFINGRPYDFQRCALTECPQYLHRPDVRRVLGYPRPGVVSEQIAHHCLQVVLQVLLVHGSGPCACRGRG